MWSTTPLRYTDPTGHDYGDKNFGNGDFGNKEFGPPCTFQTCFVIIPSEYIGQYLQTFSNDLGIPLALLALGSAGVGALTSIISATLASSEAALAALGLTGGLAAFVVAGLTFGAAYSLANFGDILAAAQTYITNNLGGQGSIGIFYDTKQKLMVVGVFDANGLPISEATWLMYSVNYPLLREVFNYSYDIMNRIYRLKK